MALEGVIRFTHCTGSTAAKILVTTTPEFTHKAAEGPKATMTYYTIYPDWFSVNTWVLSWIKHSTTAIISPITTPKVTM